MIFFVFPIASNSNKTFNVIFDISNVVIRNYTKAQYHSEDEACVIYFLNFPNIVKNSFWQILNDSIIFCFHFLTKFDFQDYFSMNKKSVTQSPLTCVIP